MDRKVTTWESKIWRGDWSELSLWTNDDDNVIVCLSPMARNTLLDIAVHSLEWSAKWKMNKNSPGGSVPSEDYMPVVQDIIRSLIMPLGCGEDLGRIATALERINDKATEALEFIDSQYISLAEFINFLDLAGLDKFIPWLDALGEIYEILNVIPDINIRFPITGIVPLVNNYFLRREFGKKLENLVLATRAVALGQAGPGIQDVIDAAAGLMPDVAENIADTVLGPLNETALTVGEDLITLLSGNYMTNRTDDVRNALNGGSVLPGDNINRQLKDIEQILADMKLAVTINQQSGCCVGGIGAPPSPPADNPADGLDPEVDPPPAGWDTWADFNSHRCVFANLLVDDLRKLFDFLSNTVAIMIVTAITALAALIATFMTGGALGYVLLIAFAAGTTAAVTIGLLRDLAAENAHLFGYFAQIAAYLEVNKQQVVCDIYSSTTTDEARLALMEHVALAADQATFEPADEVYKSFWADTTIGLAGALMNDDALNLMFDPTAALPAVTDPVDCDTCAQDHEFPWQFTGVNHGSGTFYYDGRTFTLTSGDLGGNVWYLGCTMQFVTNREDFNWCVEFVSRSVMDNTLQTNNTRQLYHNANNTNNYAFTDYDAAHSPPGVNAFPPLGQDLPISLIALANTGGPFTVDVRFKRVVVAIDSPPHTSPACD